MGKFTDLSGHRAIVTGAGNGIGLCFCRELASRGCDLLMIDIDSRRLSVSAASLHDEFPGIDIRTLTADLTRPDALCQTQEAAAGCCSEPDILINNAGIFNFSPVVELPDSRISCYLDLHVRAVTSLSIWFARMRAGKRSHILNMSSMSCWMPMPGIAMYAATKAYIRVFSRALHYEVKESGVSVTAACPGGIATDLFGLPEPLKRLAVRIGALDTPERFAKKAITRMMKGKRQYINGFINRMSILAVGMTPTAVRMAVKHRLLDKGIHV